MSHRTVPIPHIVIVSQIKSVAEIPLFHGDQWEITVPSLLGLDAEEYDVNKTTLVRMDAKEVVQKAQQEMQHLKRHFLVVVLSTPEAEPAKDEDPVISTDLTDSRQTFLGQCQCCHWQFNTLRHAQYSTMMILNHIHNKPSYCLEDCARGRVEDGSFMVGCDVCDNWYHGDCVGITKEQVRKSRFFQKSRFSHLWRHPSLCHSVFSHMSADAFFLTGEYDGRVHLPAVPREAAGARRRTRQWRRADESAAMRVIHCIHYSFATRGGETPTTRPIRSLANSLSPRLALPFSTHTLKTHNAPRRSDTTELHEPLYREGAPSSPRPTRSRAPSPRSAPTAAFDCVRGNHSVQKLYTHNNTWKETFLGLFLLEYVYAYACSARLLCATLSRPLPPPRGTRESGRRPLVPKPLYSSCTFYKRGTSLLMHWL